MNKRAAVLHRPNVCFVSDSGQKLMPWEEYKVGVSSYEAYFQNKPKCLCHSQKKMEAVIVLMHKYISVIF